MDYEGSFGIDISETQWKLRCENKSMNSSIKLRSYESEMSIVILLVCRTPPPPPNRKWKYINIIYK